MGAFGYLSNTFPYRIISATPCGLRLEQMQYVSRIGEGFCFVGSWVQNYISYILATTGAVIDSVHIGIPLPYNIRHTSASIFHCHPVNTHLFENATADGLFLFRHGSPPTPSPSFRTTKLSECPVLHRPYALLASDI